MWVGMRSQIATANQGRGGRRYLPESVERWPDPLAPWVNFGEKPYRLKAGATLGPKSWKVVYPKGVPEGK